MAEEFAGEAALRAEERERMHALYRHGRQERHLGPHIAYPEASCPYDVCDQPMRAIDFRLDDHGRAIHDPMVRAWWNAIGFVGHCPRVRRLDPFHHPRQDRHHGGGGGRVSATAGDWHARATIL